MSEIGLCVQEETATPTPHVGVPSNVGHSNSWTCVCLEAGYVVDV